jgi:hypothetical protein
MTSVRKNNMMCYQSQRAEGPRLSSHINTQHAPRRERLTRAFHGAKTETGRGEKGGRTGFEEKSLQVVLRVPLVRLKEEKLSLFSMSH